MGKIAYVKVVGACDKVACERERATKLHDKVLCVKDAAYQSYVCVCDVCERS